MLFFIHVNIKQLVPAAHSGYQRSSELPNVSNAPDSQESPLQCCNQALAGNWWAQPSQVVINTQQAQRSVPGNSVFARSTATANVHSFPPLQPHCSPAAFRRAPWENSNPFLLMLINNRIKRCVGCSFEFRDPRGPPSLGLVLQHKEKGIYFKDGMQKISAEQNRYYHPNFQCIQSRHPSFRPSLIHLPMDLCLTNDQKLFLEQGIGWQI